MFEISKILVPLQRQSVMIGSAILRIGAPQGEYLYSLLLFI